MAIQGNEICDNFQTIERIGIVMSEAKSEDQLVEDYLQYILEVNQRMNLTRIDSVESARLLHIEDSLVPLDDVVAAPAGRYGDLGTGGGFPGVPIAIYSGRKSVLIDSVGKKVAAVQEGVNSLGLGEQISTYAGRIEDLAKEQASSFSVLTARAVTKLVSLIELASPLLVPGGLLICYKAQTTQDEIDSALKVCPKVGMKLIKDYQTTLSDGETLRRIFVFEKVSKPQIKLPRKVGAAQHNPLG